MNFPEKPLPKIKEITVGRFEREPRTIVLTVRNTDEAEYQAAIASTDAGNLVASLITSVGRTLDETPPRIAELASTRVFIPGAGIGFGNTTVGPVLVAQTGGLALVFSVTRRDLFDMATQILEDLENIEEIDSPPRHHWRMKAGKCPKTLFARLKAAPNELWDAGRPGVPEPEAIKAGVRFSILSLKRMKTGFFYSSLTSWANGGIWEISGSGEARPAATGPGHFHSWSITPNMRGFQMRQALRRQAEHAKFALIVVRLNIGLCLFGIAAIITAILAWPKPRRLGRLMLRSVMFVIASIMPFAAQSSDLKYGPLPYPIVNADTWVLIEIWPTVGDITLSAYAYSASRMLTDMFSS